MKKRNVFSAHKAIHDFAVQLSERCGKDARWLEKDIIAAKKLNHIALEEYEWVGYYDMTEEQKRCVSTLWTRAELRKKYTNRLYKGVLMNKYIFSKVFSEFYGRRCMLSDGLSREDFEDLSKGNMKLVYKPLSEGQGKGIHVLKVGTAQERDESFTLLSTLSPGIVEEWICQHAELDRLYPGAVSIVRFYSVCTPAGCYLFSPVLTTAVSRDISNGCQDALTTLVDIRDGKVITDAVDQISIGDHAVHPVTGVQFKGFQVPFWQETVEMMKKVVPQAYYISNIGWDVAITENGPVLVEANTIPGFNTAQYRGYAEVTNGFFYQPIFDEAMGGPAFTDFKNYEKVLIKIR